MCGIAGIYRLNDRDTVDMARVRAMTDIQIHRGPDEEGFWSGPGVGFGHRRLAIIDLSSGQQPFSLPDGKVVLTYNGEVYNFLDVRAELEALGCVFRTRCDTEVIAWGWRVWGEKVVDRLRGMFAFAIWDADRDCLFLARDRLGVKPLHYALLADGSFLFASELKGLLAHPELPRTVRADAVEDYFALGYVPDPKCILASVSKLEAGHTLMLERGRPLPKSRKYWDVDFTPRQDGDIETVGRGLVAQLEAATRMRLVADVPLGAFLSGGVDSSAVVALMAGISKDPVNTCSIGFDQPDYDETLYANKVAQLYHTNHFTHTQSADDLELVPLLAKIYDEPFADPSAMPTYRVSELARQRVIVALSGDGGDEILAGYRRYRLFMHEERIRGLLPEGLRGAIFGTLGKVYPKLDWAPQYLRAKSTFQALAMSSDRAYYHAVSMLGDEARGRMFSEGMRKTLDGYCAFEVLKAHMDAAPATDNLSRMQYADIKTQLVGGILTKVDRASMAHSLEVRSPMLDYGFIEWAAGVPAKHRIANGQAKAVLKKAFEPMLPEDILYRPKQGFVAPIADWFRGGLKDKVRAAALGDRIADTGWFDMTTLKGLVDQHQSGLSDHSRALWALMMFEQSLDHLGVR